MMGSTNANPVEPVPTPAAPKKPAANGNLVDLISVYCVLQDARVLRQDLTAASVPEFEATQPRTVEDQADRGLTIEVTAAQVDSHVVGYVDGNGPAGSEIFEAVSYRRIARQDARGSDQTLHRNIGLRRRADCTLSERIRKSAPAPQNAGESARNRRRRRCRIQRPADPGQCNRSPPRA